MILSAGEATSRLDARLASRRARRLDIRLELRHFALITFAVPIHRLRPLVPERFEPVTLDVPGQPRGLLSAVPFVDIDFHFRVLPWVKFAFPQTNHRVYVVDRETNDHVVWFLGTTLGSRTVHLARALWKIPWYFARYEVACAYDSDARRYETFRYRISSTWCEADIDLDDTGEPMDVPPGFHTIEEARLVLTHPVAGFFWRLDGHVGTYTVAHPVIDLTRANPRKVYFGLYERLGLLSRDEMSRPHSVFGTPSTVFDVHMPPART